jgi:F-type H+-transporting ATPase subunit alpha
MIVMPENLQSTLDRVFADMSQARDAFAPQLTPNEVGVITSVSTGIAKVAGLPGVGFEELIRFPGDVLGIAFNLDEHEVGVVLLGEYANLQAGDEVLRTGRVMDVAVGDELLGRVMPPSWTARRLRYRCKPASKSLTLSSRSGAASGS